ncbi:hypothetical protein GUITHDRAFT_95409 [Guillardia theta CCMP2712]|uniref:Calcineurin-like phosphoesterase domain-containing protein n=2 Tax=Guillardia theta TaxID=55529 RepID=L1J5A3_GUITC|nr:hypothetical protein GUITHDRAFT_95409 [Guillardia theta CCMP2712]EKX43517.1 hypothetical protein GUITHDRAFT_95409 [Guillardia theta CCMP2712]|eukprot:XP_005830497.1 hypothetical protein GUITHDRAFT_95409 [Guillardia theta CCMP2712]
MPKRIVAVGDLHGDIHATRQALRLAGVLHMKRDEWIGGDTFLVQVGDQVDRGDDEIQVMSLLHRLGKQARAEGGRVEVLVGNHELMSAQGNFRYATKGAMRNFQRWSSICRIKRLMPPFLSRHFGCDIYHGMEDCGDDSICTRRLDKLESDARARYLSLRSGGTFASKFLAEERKAILIVGDTVFVHAGLLHKHFKGEISSTEAINVLNQEVAAFLKGERRAPPSKTWGNDGILWTRRFSKIDLCTDTCKQLKKTLNRLPGNVRRMVVGHSVQRDGISPACDASVWRIDVGMSKGVLATSPQVLEIKQDGSVNILGKSIET